MGLRLSSGAGRWVLLATVLGTAMAFLDSTVVNIALPAIGRDLHASLEGLQWIVTGYTLALAALILLGGALGDRYGRRKVFLIGVVWFATASLLCALAPSIGLLIAARVLQGIGGALLTPGSLAIIQASFDPDDRARAVGAWSGLGGVASAAGPFVGGWLIQGPGWRWVFLINVPLAAIVVAVTHAARAGEPGRVGRRPLRRRRCAAGRGRAGRHHLRLDRQRPSRAPSRLARRSAGSRRRRWRSSWSNAAGRSRCCRCRCSRRGSSARSTW